MKINRKLVYLKAYYFFNYGAAGSLIPLIMVHIKRLGLTPSEAGLINGITQLCSMLFRPLTGALADKQCKHKFFLLFTLFLYGCGYFSFMWIPARSGENLFLNMTQIVANESYTTSKEKFHLDGTIKLNNVDVQTNNFTYFQSYTNNNFNPVKSNVTSTNITETGFLSNWCLDITVVLVFIAFLIAKITYSSNQSLLDTVTYFMLDSKKFLYSRQRMWGTIGSMVSVLGVILVVDINYNSIFYIFIGFLFLAFCVGLALDVNVEKNNNVRLHKIIKAQISRRHILFFFFKILCFGIFLGSTMNFLFWYLKDIGIPEYFLAIIVLINCISSILVHQISPLLLKRFGPDTCMYIGLSAYAIRFLGHSFIYVQWYVIPLELLHGVTYSLIWSAASSKISALSPEGSQGTFQGLTGAIYNDLGRGLGAMITGSLFQQFNSRWVLRSYTIACCVLLVFFVTMDHIGFKLTTTETGKHEDEDPEVCESIVPSVGK